MPGDSAHHGFWGMALPNPSCLLSSCLKPEKEDPLQRGKWLALGPWLPGPPDSQVHTGRQAGRLGG